MEEVLRALSQTGRLKELARAGWVREGVPRPESVAGHSFRAALLALALVPELGADTNKLVRMLLVHDLAESDPAVGDITPYDGIPPEEKHRRERAAMERLCAALPNGAEMLALWGEYEEGRTPEARLAKQLDALEMALQAAEYEREYGLDLARFRDHARARLTHPRLVRLLEILETP
jgi:putative hydrolase of HD superfamily